MGKWTVDFYDDVLGAKLKRLVTGAVKRSSLEKGLPQITYEAFIEELDEGDSFTSSLFDLLIKELAERRLRANPSYRHLIAEQTAIGLRSLSASSLVYRDRAHSFRRRSRNYSLSDYLAGAPDEISMETEGVEGDEFETLLDSGVSAVEGMRVNTELHEAYSPPATSYEPIFPSIMRRPRSTESNTAASTVGGDNSDIYFPESLLSHSPPSSYSQIRTESARHGTAQSPSLSRQHSRQHSLRRPLRPSRLSEFGDFTSRRRISQRRTSPDVSDQPPTPSSEQPTFPHARRFFHSRRPEISGPFPWNLYAVDNHPSNTADSSSAAQNLYQTQDSPSFASSLTVPSIESYQSNPSGTPTTRHERIPFPPLRRGGIRAPESMLAHQVSIEESSENEQVHPATVHAPTSEGSAETSSQNSRVESLHPSQLVVGEGHPE